MGDSYMRYCDGCNREVNRLTERMYFEGPTFAHPGVVGGEAAYRGTKSYCPDCAAQRGLSW